MGADALVSPISSPWITFNSDTVVLAPVHLKQLPPGLEVLQAGSALALGQPGRGGGEEGQSLTTGDQGWEKCVSLQSFRGQSCGVLHMASGPKQVNNSPFTGFPTTLFNSPHACSLQSPPQRITRIEVTAGSAFCESSADSA